MSVTCKTKLVLIRPVCVVIVIAKRGRQNVHTVAFNKEPIDILRRCTDCVSACMRQLRKKLNLSQGQIGHKHTHTPFT